MVTDAKEIESSVKSTLHLGERLPGKSQKGQGAKCPPIPAE